tara:strand:+ start:7215 stop:8930 length:1716 start_codon:yes stop_codon:yes gene_type:complete
VISAFVEMFGVVSIIPFMALVGDMSKLQQDNIIADIYQASGVTSELQFVLLLGIFVFIVLVLSALTCMFTSWKTSMFASRTGADISNRLYNHYICQNWLFHTRGSSAVLTKKIVSEAGRVSNGIIMPFMQMNARIIFALFMSVSIFAYDPKVGITGFVFFVVAYLIMFKLVRGRLQFNGKVITKVSEERYRLINQGFGGIQDILILGRDYDFIKRFNYHNNELAKSLGANAALSIAPKYFIELLAFSAILTLTLYLIMNNDGNLGLILPILSVYALATFKLLPAFQQIYLSLASIKTNMEAFKSISQDLTNSSNITPEITKPTNILIDLKDKISLENISFTYPGKEEPALEKINMSISHKSVVGIVGASAAGKSTLINILLGLLIAQKGKLKIDEVTITDSNRREWQNIIGFVSQNIFISEGTIAENVAFGIPNNEIDLDQVKNALKLAHLLEFTETLDKGMHSRVGERGVQLSGGQRQRIGIARSLYHNAEVLIFDEATSALDGVTEKMVMDAINNFSGQKTIILIAHRLKTVKNCDVIFFIDKGRLIDSGTYLELIDRNDHFKNIATHA